MQRSRPEILHGLRAQPPAVIQQALDLESARRRPRTLLLPRLQERLALAVAEDRLSASMTASDNSSSSDLPKAGAPVGNQNAAKGEDGFDTVIRIRCHQADKGEWNRKARKAGIDLSEWIRTRLNEEKK